MNNHYTQYHDILLNGLGDVFDEWAVYLRGVNQKRLFARKRKSCLKKVIFKAAPSSQYLRETSNLAIEIEFDHFIESLRSSIEKLMQLTNNVCNLHLSPTIYLRENKKDNVVNIDEVILLLQKSNDSNLKKLGYYLSCEKKMDWYKTLHKLRIEMYHHIYGKFKVLNNQLLVTLPNNKIVNLISFCENEFNSTELFLSHSLRLLCRFKHLV
jgi:hypothetical protein